MTAPWHRSLARQGLLPEYSRLLWDTRTGPAVIIIGRAWLSALWNPEEATAAEQRFVVARVTDALAGADGEVE